MNEVDRELKAVGLSLFILALILIPLALWSDITKSNECEVGGGEMKKVREEHYVDVYGCVEQGDKE